MNEEEIERLWGIARRMVRADTMTSTDLEQVYDIVLDLVCIATSRGRVQQSIILAGVAAWVMRTRWQRGDDPTVNTVHTTSVQ